MKMINLKINDLPVTVPEGTTILEAARKLAIDIPTLCSGSPCRAFAVRSCRCGRRRGTSSCGWRGSVPGRSCGRRTPAWSWCTPPSWQAVGVIGPNDRGFNTHIGCAFEQDLGDVACVSCGQCIVVCPTGAIGETGGEVLHELGVVVLAVVDPAGGAGGDHGQGAALLDPLGSPTWTWPSPPGNWPG